MHQEQYLVPRYNFTRLLATAATCRQIHSEAGLSIFQLNDFRFHHVETIEQFHRSLPTAQCAAITTLRLALFSFATEDNMLMLGKCGVGRLSGLRKIIVEMSEWPTGVQNDAVVRKAFQRLYLRVLARSAVANDVKVVFE